VHQSFLVISQRTRLVRRCVIVGLLQCVGVHALCMCFYVLNRLYSYAMQFERVQKKVDCDHTEGDTSYRLYAHPTSRPPPTTSFY
jgi:hypothetical protein